MLFRRLKFSRVRYSDLASTYGFPEVPFMTTGSGLGPALLASPFLEPPLCLDSFCLKSLNLDSLSLNSLILDSLNLDSLILESLCLESGLEDWGSVKASRPSSDDGEEEYLEINFCGKFNFNLHRNKSTQTSRHHSRAV